MSPVPVENRNAIRDSDRALQRRIAEWADWFAVLAGWRRWLAATVAGVLSILSMPPFHLWPVLFVTLPVLAWLIDGAILPARAGPRDPLRPLSAARVERHAVSFPSLVVIWRAAVVGWCFGFGFHVVGLYWLREAFLVTGGAMALLWPLGVIVLPACLALFHAAAAAAVAAVPATQVRRVIALALALAATEWLRGHVFTGFPWNVLGTALTWPLALMQSASVLGIYGLTLVAVPIFTLPLVLVASTFRDNAPARRPARAAQALGLAVVIAIAPLAVMALAGALRLSATPPPTVEGVRLRLVQPAIPQRAKWQRERQLEFLRRHLELSRFDPAAPPPRLRSVAGGPEGAVRVSWPATPSRALFAGAASARTAPQSAPITHIIWPEAAMPFLPLRNPEVIRQLAQDLPRGAALLAGILRAEQQPGGGYSVFNSVAVFNDSGVVTRTYDKIHLVPFGEYLPFHETLEGIGLKALVRQRGGFVAGPSPRPVVELPGLPPAGILICYEAVFPAAIVQGGQRPAMLVNVTNDGWFGKSTGPRQHLHQARLRTVEEGLPLVRVANNGVSAVFDAYGRELARLELDVAGVIDSDLPGAIAAPIYARFGDLGFALLWLVSAAALYLSGRRRNSA